MRYLLSLLCLNSVILFSGFSQDVHTLSGTITDSLTSEPLVGATVLVQTANSGTMSDLNGAFRIELPNGVAEITISYIGYHSKELRLELTEDVDLDIRMLVNVTQSEEVVVTARNPEQNATSTRTGLITLSGSEIERIPTLMGEADVIRVLNYSPGVQSANDGNSGFNVRGGNVDQNLILLDNAIVFNPSHVLGFFSVFNSEAISNATLIKSGIPAEYGGRLSSVLDVQSVDGDFEAHHVAGSVGLLSSKVAVHGPLIRNKLSWFASFRRSYIDEVFRPVARAIAKNDEGFFAGTGYNLYDVNVKLSGRINERNRLSLLFYQGKDDFRMDRQQQDYFSEMGWGNTIASLNWNLLLTDSSFISNTLSYSRYDFQYESGQFILNMNLFSEISNLTYHLEYTGYRLLNGTVKAGLDAHYFRFVPNRFLININQVDLDYGSYQDLFAGDAAGYASYERDFLENLRLYAGVRISSYSHIGPYTESGDDVTNGSPDTTYYGSGQFIKSYVYPEPRLSLRYQTGTSSSVKASYTRNYQFIHVASAAAVTMPSDIWIPSTSRIRPQFGDQLTLGYYFGLSNGLVASVEAYHKNLRNQIELVYGIGASIQDKSLDQSITTGKGSSSGIEFYVQKQQGRLTGWLGYSLSRSVRQFERINNGIVYPSKFDRRHEVNAVMNYRIGDRWDLSAAFILASGNAMTVPTQKYFIEGNILNVYSQTNAFRMPAYHRMDLSATWHLKARGKFESDLNFSVFNAYNRANPFLIYYEISGDIAQYNLEIAARQITVFPVLPSISWSFRF